MIKQDLKSRNQFLEYSLRISLTNIVGLIDKFGDDTYCFIHRLLQDSPDLLLHEENTPQGDPRASITGRIRSLPPLNEFKECILNFFHDEGYVADSFANTDVFKSHLSLNCQQPTMPTGAVNFFWGKMKKEDEVVYFSFLLGELKKEDVEVFARLPRCFDQGIQAGCFLLCEMYARQEE